MTKPLEGVRIIDLTHMLSGPYAGMLLADLGAESIKVEPLKGEGTRSLLANNPKYSHGGQGAYFITLNRNNKSVCIDLKSEGWSGHLLRPGARRRRGAGQLLRWCSHKAQDRPRAPGRD